MGNNSKQQAYIFRSSNSEVTDFYMDIVQEALAKAGFGCTAIRKTDCREEVLAKARKEDLVVVASCLEALKYMIKGFRNVIVWCQGIVPEESYMRQHSKPRKDALSLVEKIVLKRASFLLFVSNEMKRHYVAKYGLDFEGRCGVMPCFNSELCVDSIRTKGKYDQPTFTYVGSLAAWQCFDETAKLFKSIEEKIDGAVLKVFSFDKKGAEERLLAAGVRNYTVSSVPPEQMPLALKDVAFGFVLRNDCEVNRVATPTKLSSYISSGVIPIFSKCLKGFDEASRGMEYVLPIGAEPDMDEIIDFCTRRIDVEKLLSEYKGLFAGYYSRESYANELSKILSVRFSNNERCD